MPIQNQTTHSSKIQRKIWKFYRKFHKLKYDCNFFFKIRVQWFNIENILYAIEYSGQFGWSETRYLSKLFTHRFVHISVPQNSRFLSLSLSWVRFGFFLNFIMSIHNNGKKEVRKKRKDSLEIIRDGFCVFFLFTSTNANKIQFEATANSPSNGKKNRIFEHVWRIQIFKKKNHFFFSYSSFSRQ